MSYCNATLLKALIMSSTVAVLTLVGCKQAPNFGALSAQIDIPKDAMVAAADPRAVEAGLEALRAGGNAVDAAIAVQSVLGLVEPQSSGIGGGAFMIYYDASTGETTMYDGRETAPAGVTDQLFFDDAGPESSSQTLK